MHITFNIHTQFRSISYIQLYINSTQENKRWGASNCILHVSIVYMKSQ